MFKIATSFLILALAVTGQAQAYAEKTYECQNGDGTPQNTYKIQNQQIGNVTVPFVEARLHYRIGDQNSPVQTSTLKGFATVLSSGPNQQTLMLGGLSLEFDGDNLLRCRAQ